MIDRATIQRVMDAADIVEVVRDFVSLRKAGTNYKGLCPFHNEKTPSFVVTPAKQICKCFGCGKGGDAVHFIMEIEQLSFPEAIKWLGKKYGIEVREKEETEEEKAAASVREGMFVLNDWACEFFEHTLHDHPDGIAVGMSYLRGRGLRDDIIRRFRLGYSLEQKDSLCTEALRKGYSRENLQKTGLGYETDDHRFIDKYRARVIFPIFTVSGRVVGFGGRILSNEKKMAKYINSPESEIYNKSRELYGLYQAKKAIVRENRCFLVEGYMDVISMHQSGVENVVASSGTSLTEGQIRLVHRFTNNITVLYDGDAAGIHASLRGIDMLLAEGMNIKVLLLPDGEDPDSFAQSRTAEDFKAYIDAHQTDFITFKTDLLLKGTAGDPLRKAEVVSDIVRSISVIPDGIVRQTYAHECSTRMQMDEGLILSEVSKMRRRRLVSAAPSYSAEERRGTEHGESPAEGGMENGAENADSSQPSAPAQEARTASALRPLAPATSAAAELRLVQQVMRYGEVVLLDAAAAEGAEAEEQPAVTVAEFVADDLAADGLAFDVPLHARILHEAVEHVREPDFHAEGYFLTHPDAEVNTLAQQLCPERVQLSRQQREQYGEEREHLVDIVPRLLNDFKYEYVRREMKQVEQQILALSSQEDYEACMQLMARYKQLSELLAAVSQATGDRVVL
ncbi:MAG: DNA primase [Alloprevotella sp.]|nr:DNA primase [Alloprevotella sp.]MBR1595028.1 DNA primase [Alloprevotella sp.]